MKIETVGLIGHGRFGAMAARYLRRRCRLLITDADDRRLEDVAEAAAWKEVVRCNVIVLAVPISALEAVCRRLAADVGAGQLVIDTCSVKQRPVKVMAAELPGDVQIVGTHPLFGPDSGQDGIAGLKIALCPVRVEEPLLEAVRAFLEGIGLVVIETTPEEHDRQLARSQAIFHLIAQALKELDWGGQALSTPGPAAFFRLVRTVQSDTAQLFRDLERENPFAEEYRRLFLAQLDRLHAELGSSGEADDTP